MKEIWKPLYVKNKSFSDYLVSNLGNIKNIKLDKIIETSVFRGKKIVNIQSDFLSWEVVQVHRAVAENFLENPKNYLYVLFIDGNHMNCSVENLVWSKNNKESISEEEALRRKRASYVKKVTKKRKQLKEKAVEYKGGSCILCGYNRCLAALDFHHLDPSQKDFKLSDMYSKSWKSVLEELDKCVLVCANCHREIESGFIKL